MSSKTQMNSSVTESMEIIESNLTRLSNKYSTFVNSTNASVNSLLEHIETLQRELLTGPDVEQDGELSVMAVMMWEKALEQLKKLSKHIALEHREIHSHISKCGREIEKTFFSNYNSLCQKIIDYEADPVLSRCINTLIVQHLLMSGLFECAEKFANESNVEIDQNTRQTYLELEVIHNALKQRNLDPALNWCRTHSEKLMEIGSVLEFNLHKLKFVELLNRGVCEQFDTLAYARVFQDFAQKHSTDIQTLMGALLYIPRGLDNSPYKFLQEQALWNELCAVFIKEACLLLGLPDRSPLGLILDMGTKAVPALLFIRQIMQQRQTMGMWSHNDELPIAIEVSPDKRFHSVFSCPILRQQTTDKNPPMRINCGHVISREALQKLASNNKLKCPYCPQESFVSEAKQLYF